MTAKTSSRRDVFRARIILALAEGLSHQEISREQGVSLLAMGRWRKRWAAEGLEGREDAPGRGCKPTIAASAIRWALSVGCSTGSWRRTLERARDGAGNRLEQIERSTFVVGLTPSLPIESRSCKLSKDLAFEEKLWDVVGLYLNPPDRALLLCCDEKCSVRPSSAVNLGCP